jgi:hypothetical protein
MNKKKKKKEKFNLFRPSKISLYLYVIILGIILVFGILNIVFRDATLDYEEEAIENCVALCKQELAKGNLLESGPCLSENVALGWGCDVVHSPRVSFLDDQKENMCENKDGTIKYLVEVTKTCELVRTNSVSIVK